MIGIKDFVNYVSLCALSVSPGERFATYEVKQAVLIRGENHSLSRCGRPVQRIKRLYEIRKWLDAHLK